MQQSLVLRFRLLVMLGVAAVAAGGSPVRAADPPDFTGVWTTYQPPAAQARGAGGPGGAAPAAGRAAGGAGRGGATALPMTEVGRQKVAAYRALVGPTSDT